MGLNGILAIHLLVSLESINASGCLEMESRRISYDPNGGVQATGRVVLSRQHFGNIRPDISWTTRHSKYKLKNSATLAQIRRHWPTPLVPNLETVALPTELRSCAAQVQASRAASGNSDASGGRATAGAPSIGSPEPIDAGARRPRWPVSRVLCRASRRFTSHQMRN